MIVKRWKLVLLCLIAIFLSICVILAYAAKISDTYSAKKYLVEKYNLDKNQIQLVKRYSFTDNLKYYFSIPGEHLASLLGKLVGNGYDAQLQYLRMDVFYQNMLFSVNKYRGDKSWRDNYEEVLPYYQKLEDMRSILSNHSKDFLVKIPILNSKWENNNIQEYYFYVTLKDYDHMTAMHHDIEKKLLEENLDSLYRYSFYFFMDDELLARTRNHEKNDLSGIVHSYEEAEFDDFKSWIENEISSVYRLERDYNGELNWKKFKIIK